MAAHVCSTTPTTARAVGNVTLPTAGAALATVWHPDAFFPPDGYPFMTLFFVLIVVSLACFGLASQRRSTSAGLGAPSPRCSRGEAEGCEGEPLLGSAQQPRQAMYRTTDLASRAGGAGAPV
eukprot:TRINITY_DN78097_c0_g1_i1.p2 TRINITY_DN78097_c0_g1~~TRINITY_DN78097_c0_g1_i1.p2  ORF type:complete len:139 (+),score=28.12 TRINITY_DN78097_c0_g1_i1:53-418(+)